jgi:hypothetical protein
MLRGGWLKAFEAVSGSVRTVAGGGGRGWLRQDSMCPNVCGVLRGFCGMGVMAVIEALVTMRAVTT